MVSQIFSMGLYGMDAFPVEVEADLSQGLPSFEIVEYYILTMKQHKRTAPYIISKERLIRS